MGIASRRAMITGYPVYQTDSQGHRWNMAGLSEGPVRGHQAMADMTVLRYGKLIRKKGYE